jgi:hypothetical protein
MLLRKSFDDVDGLKHSLRRILELSGAARERRPELGAKDYILQNITYFSRYPRNRAAILLSDLRANHASSHSGDVSVTSGAVLPEGMVCQVFAQVNICKLPVCTSADVSSQVIVPTIVTYLTTKYFLQYLYPSIKGTDSKTRLTIFLASMRLLLFTAQLATVNINDRTKISLHCIFEKTYLN